MKILLSFILFALLPLPSVAVTALDLALETGGIKVKYSDLSKKGVVYAYKCGQCTQKFYEFSGPIKVTKQNKNMPFSEFMEDYWNAKYPTVFLDPDTLNVLHISY